MSRKLKAKSMMIPQVREVALVKGDGLLEEHWWKGSTSEPGPAPGKKTLEKGAHSRQSSGAEVGSCGRGERRLHAWDRCADANVAQEQV